MYSGSGQLISFEIRLISKRTSRTEPECMIMHPPPPINVLDRPLFLQPSYCNKERQILKAIVLKNDM